MPDPVEPLAATARPPYMELDAVVVGAGFSGLYMLHRLRQLGLSARVYEAGSGIGGTWFWNRYPGARCDIESMDYSYSFSEELEQDWEWTEKFPTQPEILRYIEHVADRFDLRRDIQLETRVTQASFDETTRRWQVRTDGGDTVSVQFCIMAVGCLSVRKQPEIRGLETFRGTWYHTGHWPHESVSFNGQEVGVIGTGSSGIQSIPVIAKEAAQLTVFQRTPNFSLPARNEPLDPEVQRAMKVDYPGYRRRARRSRGGVPAEQPTQSALAVDDDERLESYQTAWERGSLFALGASYTDLLTNRAANDTAAEFIRSKIREAVDDPDIAEMLAPTDHPFGSKRPCLDSGYYATYNRDNVRLIDLRKTPIVEVTPAGIRTTEREHELDSLVFATGFDAMTGPLLAIDIRGTGGRPLREKWARGPRSYLGIGIAGFPNLFTLTGPGSPSVLTNMMVSIEQHVEWVVDCIAFVQSQGFASIEATVEAEDAWVRHVHDLAAATLMPTAGSWYMGANVPGKPRVFMPYIGGADVYRKRCDEIAANRYEGFLLNV